MLWEKALKEEADHNQAHKDGGEEGTGQTGTANVGSLIQRHFAPMGKKQEQSKVKL